MQVLLYGGPEDGTWFESLPDDAWQAVFEDEHDSSMFHHYVFDATLTELYEDTRVFRYDGLKSKSDINVKWDEVNHGKDAA